MPNSVDIVQAGPSWRPRSRVRAGRRTLCGLERNVLCLGVLRHFQQDLAATEEMLHRVLDVLEGVHARHGDNEAPSATSGAASRMTGTTLSR